jgi:hypothetical protein
MAHTVCVVVWSRCSVGPPRVFPRALSPQWGALRLFLLQLSRAVRLCRSARVDCAAALAVGGQWVRDTVPISRLVVSIGAHRIHFCELCLRVGA